MSGRLEHAELETVSAPFVIDIVEELDLASLPDFRLVLEEATSAGVDVIVDLTRCEFVDGACVRELLLTQARVGLQDQRLVVISKPDTAIFFILRLIERQALTLYPTQQLGQIALQLP